MTSTHMAAEATRARLLRQQIELDKLDYRRELLRLAALGNPQRELAATLGISQPSLSTSLATARQAAPIRPGFSGATPYEICQRHSVGELTREQVIDELTRWEYSERPASRPEFFDDLRFTTPGSFDDVCDALQDRLVDAATYDAILAAMSKNATTSARVVFAREDDTTETPCPPGGEVGDTGGVPAEKVTMTQIPPSDRQP